MKVSAGLDEITGLLAQDATIISLTRQLARARASFPVSDAKVAEIIASMGDTIRATQVLTSILGAERVLKEIEAHIQPGSILGRARVDASGTVDRIAPGLGRTGGVEAGSFHVVPFREAIEDVLSRRPVLAVGFRRASEAYTKEHAYALAKSMDVHVTERVQAAILDHIRGGSARDEVEAIVARLGDWPTSYAETVHRTNAATAYAEGRMAQARDPDVAIVAPALRFTATRDGDTRPNHLAADGLVAAPDDPVWRVLRPPLGYRCVLPDTLVSGRIESALEIGYSGPAVTIETASGKRLSVTINHPVLSDGRWKPACDVKEGDHLLRYGADVETLDYGQGLLASPRMAGRAVDDEHRVARAVDVFEALRREAVVGVGRVGVLSRAPVLPLDLHGDGRYANSDVHRVGTDWVLPDGVNAARLKQVRQFSLVSAYDAAHLTDHRRGATDLLVLGRDAPARSIPCRPALTSADVGVIRSLAALRPLESLRLGPASNLYVVAREERRYGGSADPEFCRELKDARPGLVSGDRVVRIRRFEYSGHVYDFQTGTGWILANGIVISNCRCGLELVDRIEAERLGILLPDGRVRPASIPPGAYPDPGFRGGGL